MRKTVKKQEPVRTFRLLSSDEIKHLLAWKKDDYLPVEGCEECKIAKTACLECFLNGHAERKGEKL